MKQWAMLAAASLMMGGALAQVTVKEAWVRATVPQQKATGAFMQVQSAKPARLVAASSPVAGVVEVHEMAMDNGVMRMRAVPGLDLPAGKAVDLKPGGFHVMLMDLKRQVKDGEQVPLTLSVQGADGKTERIEVQATVRGNAPAASHVMPHGQHKH